MSRVPARIGCRTRCPAPAAAVASPAGGAATPAGAAPPRGAGMSLATPTSRMVTVAPIPAARTLIAAPPATKFATIWAVTSGG